MSFKTTVNCYFEVMGCSGLSLNVTVILNTDVSLKFCQAQNPSVVHISSYRHKTSIVTT